MAAHTMKRPAKSAAELEALIRVELEEICAWPTDMTVAVHPDGETWKATIMHEHQDADARLIEVLETIIDRLREEFDLEHFASD
jgi:hypothetical protein